MKDGNLCVYYLTILSVDWTSIKMGEAFTELFCNPILHVLILFLVFSLYSLFFLPCLYQGADKHPSADSHVDLLTSICC